MKFQNKVLLGALRGHQNAVPFTVLDPVMGLVPFLAGRLVGGLAEPLNGFPFILYRIAYMADVWFHVSIWRNIAIYSEIPNEPDAGVLSKTVDESCNNETCQTPSDPFQEV